MKTKFTQTKIAFLLIFFIGFSMKAQKTKYFINLKVNTENITKETIEENANFGQPDTVLNKDFTLDAEIGDRVVWRGSDLSKANRSVRIEWVKIESGDRLFNERNIYRSFWRKITFNRKLGKNFILEGEQKYKIRFSFRKNGRRHYFEIDPKLKIRKKKKDRKK